MLYRGGVDQLDLASSPPLHLSRLFSAMIISSLPEAQTLINDGHLMPSFRNFWQAALDAHNAGRLDKACRITTRNNVLPGYDVEVEQGLRVEVLGPVPTTDSGTVAFIGFPKTEDLEAEAPLISSSHTRNGHSLVLKLRFGKHSILFGGDLNIPAQLHLMSHYGDENPFRVDIAKACHHGPSDFHADFLKKVLPHVNIVSSGDNMSFDHPMADAIGCAAKHTRGTHPLLFSTELARAVSSAGIHFGLINVRSNGKLLTMAQMKEQHRNKADVWDSFTVPWKGRFASALEG